MISVELIHATDLDIYESEDLDTNLNLKNYLLFSKYNDEIVAFTSQRYMIEASNYYTKLSQRYPFKVLDEDSFEKLYNKFLELRTDKAIETMQEESDESEIEEDISLTDFLRTSSDILTSEESAPIIKFVNALFYQAVKKELQIFI